MAKRNTTDRKKRPRTKKEPTYKSFRLAKKIRPAPTKPLPGIIKLSKLALAPLKNNKKLFFGILLIHFVFTLVFVSGIGTSLDFVEVKNDLDEAFGGSLDKTTSAFALFSYALTSSSGTSNSSANYQIFISLIVSLAVIWSIRQVLAGEKIGVRQAFYQGIYPLVPFLVIIFVIGLQLIPFAIGSFVITTILANSLAISVLELSFWWVIFGLLSLLSFYMVLSSIFGLYISTLPDMTPLRALRSARGLVVHRRLQLVLRLLGLPIILAGLYVVILVPLIFIAPILVVPFFLLLGSFGLFFIHSYLYNLYRSLL